MKIVIKAGDKTITARLFDSDAARDFAGQLLPTMTLEDYAGTEKIGYLPKQLSTKGAPGGTDPSPGDVTYYAPWGNLAIFYKDFGYSRGLILLGGIDSGGEALSRPGSLLVTFERVEQ